MAKKHHPYTEAVANVTEAGHRLGIAADHLLEADPKHALAAYLKRQSAGLLALAAGIKPPASDLPAHNTFSDTHVEVTRHQPRDDE